MIAWYLVVDSHVGQPDRHGLSRATAVGLVGRRRRMPVVIHGYATPAVVQSIRTGLLRRLAIGGMQTRCTKAARDGVAQFGYSAR